MCYFDCCLFIIFCKISSIYSSFFTDLTIKSKGKKLITICDVSGVQNVNNCGYNLLNVKKHEIINFEKPFDEDWIIAINSKGEQGIAAIKYLNYIQKPTVKLSELKQFKGKYQCTTCSYSSFYKDTVLRHISLYKGTCAKIALCNVCHRRLPVRKVHTCDISAQLELKCSKCFFEFKNLPALKQHVRNKKKKTMCARIQKALKIVGYDETKVIVDREEYEMLKKKNSELELENAGLKNIVNNIL